MCWTLAVAVTAALCGMPKEPEVLLPEGPGPQAPRESRRADRLGPREILAIEVDGR